MADYRSYLGSIYIYRGKKTIVLFLDLAKAFHIISQKFQFDRLHHIGITGKAYDLIKSFMSGRSQLMNNGALPEINYGVLQGSTFGPIFFIF